MTNGFFSSTYIYPTVVWTWQLTPAIAYVREFAKGEEFAPSYVTFGVLGDIYVEYDPEGNAFHTSEYNIAKVIGLS